MHVERWTALVPRVAQEERNRTVAAVEEHQRPGVHRVEVPRADQVITPDYRASVHTPWLVHDVLDVVPSHRLEVDHIDATHEQRWTGSLDPELAAAVVHLSEIIPLQITAAQIEAVRAAIGGQRTAEDVVAGRAVEFEHQSIEGYRGGTIEVTVFRRRGSSGGGPGILHLHGGGMILGNRFDDIDQPLDWVERHDAICVAVEYRLAPEHPDPVPVEDAHAALVWLVVHSDALSIDSARVVLFGASAGGGLAAGTALLARDRGGSTPVGQMLVYPMLDDRDRTPSTERFAVGGTWDRVSNRTAWTALLGARRAGHHVTPYAAPARAERLDGLPAAYVDCGTVDLFLDEDVAYAQALRRDGVPTELHLWPGAFHAFDDLVPTARITARARSARDRWFADLVERS